MTEPGKLHRAVLILAYMAAAVIGGVYALNGWTALNAPYSLNYESPILWATVQLAELKNIYPKEGLIHEPWSVILYPPLYMMLAAIPVKLFGASYLWLRLLSMVSLLVAAIAMYRAVLLTVGTKLSAITATIFFCSFDLVCTQYYHARPDMLETALSAVMIERLVSVSTMPHGNSKPSVLRYWQTALFGFLAFSAKQQAATFLIAAVLYLLSTGQKKAGAFLFVFWLASIALLGAILELVSGGGFFGNFFLLRPIKPDNMILIVNLASLELDWVKVIMGVLIIPLGVVFAPDRKFPSNFRLPLLIFAVSFATMMYTMGIPAASPNHMIPTLFGLAWLVAGCLRFLPTWVTAIVLIGCLVNTQRLCEFGIYGPKLFPHQIAAAEALSKLPLEGKVVLTDDVFLNYLTKSSPAIVDCATFLNLWKATGKRPEEMLNKIEKRAYGAVMINMVDSRRGGNIIWWTPDVVESVKKNYDLKETVNCSGWAVDVYLPRN